MAIAPTQSPLPFIHPDDMPDLYCLPGLGACMEPLIPDGALIAFDKREKPRRGDIVCLTFTREAARRHGFPGMIKRLAMDLPHGGGDALIAVEMLNPPRRLSYRASELLAVHKCVGLPERRADGTAWLRIGKGKD
jgi:hypothetical protein